MIKTDAPLSLLRRRSGSYIWHTGWSESPPVVTRLRQLRNLIAGTCSDIFLGRSVNTRCGVHPTRAGAHFTGIRSVRAWRWPPWRKAEIVLLFTPMTPYLIRGMALPVGEILWNYMAKRHAVVVTTCSIFAKSGVQISDCIRAVVHAFMSIPPGHSCMNGLIHNHPTLCNLRLAQCTRGVRWKLIVLV
jgi:hypothetical protein